MHPGKSKDGAMVTRPEQTVLNNLIFISPGQRVITQDLGLFRLYELFEWKGWSSGHRDCLTLKSPAASERARLFIDDLPNEVEIAQGYRRNSDVVCKGAR
jgi:hypothetical protein